MTTLNQLPQITAPSLRVTSSGEQFTSYLRGDLKQVREQAQLWLRLTAREQIENQLRLGNSKDYRMVVDGNDHKPLSEAKQKVVVYFVTAVLARNMLRAKEILRKAILRVSERRTGLLSEGWVWAFQKERKAPFQLLGSTLPKQLELRQGNALILVPRAGYAFFVNYYASQAQVLQAPGE